MSASESFSPMEPRTQSNGLTFERLPLSPVASEVDFGVETSLGDVDQLSDADFAELERAVLTHQVVVVRDQQRLTPRQQFELTRRFDPTVQTYGHGHREELLKQSILTRDLISIPDVPQVKLLGNGRLDAHESLSNVELQHPSHRGFHRTPLSAAEEAQGLTRFYRWHIDAALYDFQPPKVTTLLALTVPRDRPQTVVYDDESGDMLQVSLGATVFVSGYRAFEALSEAQRGWALRARARYAPHPYIWMRRARARSNGLGLFSEGQELTRGELPEIDPAKLMTLPLVWRNPLTGRCALQVHAFCVEDLLVDGRSCGSLRECRRLLYQLMRPAIAPARVYAHAWRPGDLVIFDNRSLWHSVVGSLLPTDLRIYHQCNLASNEPPSGALS